MIANILNKLAGAPQGEPPAPTPINPHTQDIQESRQLNVHEMQLMYGIREHQYPTSTEFISLLSHLMGSRCNISTGRIAVMSIDDWQILITRVVQDVAAKLEEASERQRQLNQLVRSDEGEPQ